MKKTLILALIVLSAVQLRAAEPVTDAREAYHQQKSALMDNYRAQSELFREKYLGALDAMQAKFQKAADLDAVVAIRDERTRFEKSGSLRKDHLSKTNRTLHGFQAKALTAFSRMNTAKDNALRSQRARYEQALNQSIIELTKAGQLEEALALRDELKKIEQRVPRRGPSPRPATVASSSRRQMLSASPRR